MSDIILNRAEGSIQFTTGNTLLSTTRNGTFEFDGNNLYFTIGSVRKRIKIRDINIGDTFQGGVVFYITAPVSGATSGTAGLICKTSDMSGTGQWGCYGTKVSGADGTAIGTGEQNTIDIHNQTCMHTPTAANYCFNLTAETYSDWWLPSLNELGQMQIQKSIIGGFGSYSYWSSSEYNNNDAKYINFNGLTATSLPKNTNAHVRAIRRF